MDPNSSNNSPENQMSFGAGEAHYAGLGIRSLAFILDLLFLGFLVGIIQIALYGEVKPAFGLLDIDFQTILLLFIVFVLYFGWTESSRSQASLGKMIMDLKVVNENGGRISFIASVMRYLLTFVSTISLGFGFWAAFRNNKKAGWHDVISKTYVVKSNRNHDEF